MKPNSKETGGPEGTIAQSHAQSAKDESSEHKSGEDQDDSPTRDGSADQCATAQDSAQQTSPTTTTTQGATAPEGGATSGSQSTDRQWTRAGAGASSKPERSDYNWVAQFLKGTHDILWPSEPVTSASPSLIGLTLGTSKHLIDNLMEWESKFESADLEGHKQFLQEAELPVCDSPLEATAWENGLSQKLLAFQLTN